MKLAQFSLSLILLLQLTACSGFFANRGNLNAQVDLWLAENEFGRVEDTLRNLSPDHPEYNTIKRRKKNIGVKKAAFITATLARADRLLTEKKWKQAIDVYQEAQDKIPGNAIITSHKNELIKQHAEKVRELNRDLAMHNARALIGCLTMYEELEVLEPDDPNLQSGLNRIRREKEELATELLKYGEESLQKKNYDLADECIDLSNQLVASSAKNAILISIREKKKSLVIPRRRVELIKAYREAYDQGDFSQAGSHLETLIALDGNNTHAKALKSQLERDIDLRVERGVAEGKTLYSQGKINEALVIWEELLKIDPQNEELAAYVVRGKKVSTKIKTLEESTNN